MVPTFADYLRKAYFPALAASGKRPASVAKAKHQLERWAKELGQVRLNKLGPGHLDAVLVKISNEGLSGRTINLYVIAARNLIKAAARDRHCQRPLPFEGIVWLKWDRKTRSLVTPEEVNRLVETAIAELHRRGRDLADYIRFLQFTGCRFNPAIPNPKSAPDWQMAVGMEPPEVRNRILARLVAHPERTFRRWRKGIEAAQMPGLFCWAEFLSEDQPPEPVQFAARSRRRHR